MEDRRCRQVMALILTTVIILSVSVQNASAAPEKSTEKLYNRVMDFKQTILTLTDTKENPILKLLTEKFSDNKVKGLANKVNLENEILFVIEQIPLEKVLGTDAKKVNNSVVNKTDQNKNKKAVKTITASRSAAPEILKDDLELLARIIHAEARGESFEGQIAVGAVVLNRVQHPDFPKSIREVVYQPGQFTAITDKQIELTPNNKAYQAAQAALEGQDPSKGAIYYYNPKTATDQWIRTRSIVRSIGNHKFCV